MGHLGRKNVNVTVHGYTSTESGADGRYGKQARINKKITRKKIRNMALVPRSPRELCEYIEKNYDVRPLPEDDELYVSAAEKLREGGEIDLTVYNIVVMQGSQPAAWLTVYVEANRKYLAFEKIDLECDDDYSVGRVIADIVNFFGAGPEDKKQKNDRYQQLISVQ